MKTALLLVTALLALAPGLSRAEAPSRDLILAVGAAGEPEFGKAFATAAETWMQEAAAAGLRPHRIPNDAQSLENLRRQLADLPPDGGDLWIVLIGHGTYDGRNAKFNLTGDDLSAKELARLLTPFTRRVIVLNLFSAAGAFLPELSGENRVIVCATRSGAERNYSRFGEKLAAALSGPDADLDGDGRVSLAELTIRATAETQKFYVNAQRLVPEHAVIDDNGDRSGTETTVLLEPAVSGGTIRDGEAAREITLRLHATGPSLDAAQLRERDRIEAELATIRAHKSELDEAAYLDRIEPLLLQMADLYNRVEAAPAR